MIQTIEPLEFLEEKEPTLSEIKKTVREDCFKPNPVKASLFLLFGLIQFLFAGAFSFVVWSLDYAALFPLSWFVMGFVFTSLFVLGHDCAHESLTGKKWLNSFLGHILFIPTFYPYYAWKYSHAAHHQHTNELYAPENTVYFDNAWIPMTVNQYKTLKKQSYLLAALYKITRLFIPLGSLMHNLIYHYIPSKFKKDHKENVYFSYLFLFLAVIVIGTSIYFVTRSIFALFHFWVIPAFFFQFWMSLYTFLHHTSEDMSFYPQSEWNQYRGQIKSTTNYKMPKWISSLHFHIDIHIPHHLNIKIPSYMLLAAQKDLNNSKYSEDIQEEFFTWKHYFRVIRNCNLWDENKKGYVRFSDI
ncbi:MAG: fatty acid desaturase [Leptospiraceae bacterium]|nr:fatty acid desaturase [Leptospiraceae bacterium]